MYYVGMHARSVTVMQVWSMWCYNCGVLHTEFPKAPANAVSSVMERECFKRMPDHCNCGGYIDGVIHTQPKETA
jgi:hypothetical protein